MKWVSTHTTLAAASILLAALVACTSKPSAPPQPQAPVIPIDPATIASVSGTVSFTGAAPDARAIDMTFDPACQGANRAETFAVNNGKLANVFVYVKEGLGTRAFPAPSTPVAVEQTNCRYQPHVVGVQTGQTLRFLNHDATNHNIHAMAQNNEGWNQSQMPKAPPLDQAFSTPEIMLPIKCNQHPWMKMYANVVPHPFFAVTDAAGSYAIRGLPPGDYTLAFVHEKLGEQTVKISLQPKQNAVADATFKP